MARDKQSLSYDQIYSKKPLFSVSEFCLRVFFVKTPIYNRDHLSDITDGHYSLASVPFFLAKLIHLWAITLISMDMFSYSDQNVLSLFHLKLNSDEFGKRPTV